MWKPEYRRITGEWESGGSQEAVDIFLKATRYAKVIAIIVLVVISLIFLLSFDLPAASLMILVVTLAGIGGAHLWRKAMSVYIDSFKEGQKDQVKMFDTTYGEAVRVCMDALDALGWEYSVDAKGDLTVPGRGPLVESRSDRTSPVEESKEVVLKADDRAIKVEVSEMKDLPYTHLEYIHVRMGPVDDGNASEVEVFKDHLDAELPPFLLDPDDYKGR